MTWFTFVPGMVMTVVSIALGWRAPPLHPQWSARLLATVAGTTVLAVLGTLVFVSVNHLAGLAPRTADRLPEWMLFGDDRLVPPQIGWPAVVFACLGLAIALQLTLRWAAEIRAAQSDSQDVVDTDVPIAVAVPGRRGGVLVSRGLLAGLTAAELQVVFQHERSHLRHRHHRYLVLGTLVAGLLPPLRRLNEQLKFSLERWADEDAAEAVEDRHLVAYTIARVALARSAGSILPAFSDCGVVQRVEALLGTPPDKNSVSGPVVVAGAGITTSGLASTALQLDALAFALVTLVIQ
jgi:hypothetical protein